MGEKESTVSTGRNLLIFAFVFVILSACIFSGMGYYYLTYRNKLMQNAVVKSGRMTVGMLVRSLELDIISLENKMILEVALHPASRADSLQLDAIRRNNPIVDTLFVHIDRPAAKENEREADLQGWLMQKVATQSAGSPPVPLALYHFSGVFKETAVQAGFILLPPTPGQKPTYLVFTLDLDFIRDELLQPTIKKSARAFSKVTILDRIGPLAMEHPGDNTALSVEASFATILPFWAVTADIDTRGMGKRARMELITYSGIIILVLLLIGVSIYFIWMQMQQERRISQVKSQMISHVSHELKTPLALIRMYTETLMLGRVAERAKTRQYYRIILSECDRLHLLINNTLDFSSIEKGVKEYNFGKGDINQAVQEIITSYGYYLQEHGFAFQADLDPHIAPFSFDRIALMQMVGNLLDNAMKFSPDTKSIRLSLRQRDDNVVLEVTDQGVGIQAEALQAIFQPYRRLSNRFRGSGIGLALVRHAVLAHHGTIDVKSTLDRGSTFTVTLPLSAGEDAVEGDV
jgi:signal transduction histidine kinase